MDVFNQHGKWQESLPEQLKKLQGLHCPYCFRQKIGEGALLAPACERKKCRERAAADFGLPFQLHCVLRGMAMGYEEKQIPALMVRSKPEVGREDGITIHTIKQYRKVIAQKLGLPNKQAVLVAWYIARAMELEYNARPCAKPEYSLDGPTLKSSTQNETPRRSNPPKRSPAKRTAMKGVSTEYHSQHKLNPSSR
jgi:hypothetical protein